MSFLEKYKIKQSPGVAGPLLPRSPTDGGLGRAIWQEVFGTNKEERFNQPPPVGQRLGPLGGTLSGTEQSFVRTLRALRSGAPPGWTANRWEQTQHFVGVFYVAVHRICMQLMQAEFQVFIKDEFHPDGKRPVTRRDPPTPGKLVQPYELVQLLERPNNQDSFGKWMYRLGQQKFLTGSALNWLVPNALGVPYEMYIVPTALAVPVFVSTQEYPDGYFRIQPFYPYGPYTTYTSNASATGTNVPAQWIWPRFQYPHPLIRGEGYSPQTALSLHLDEVESIDTSRWYSMKRSFNPAAVLNLDPESEPLPESEITRIKAEFENSFQGPQNTGALFVGGPGCSLENFGIRPQEMDYQSGWDQLVSFIMGGIGITKPAAGMIEDASYSNLFATLKQLNLVTLDPECADISAELTRHVAPFFGDGLIVEVRCRRIDDYEILHQKLQLLLAAKCITKNEFRHEMEMPLTQEPWGNEIAGMDPMMLPQPMMGAAGPIPLDDPTMQMEMLQEEERVAYEEAQLDELENDRPGPDGLARGGLGGREDTPPNNERKSIMDVMQTKSLYDNVREVCRNGK